jgi:protein-L-isoaspartate(D-aspartate) O-methyltransferase
MSLLGKRIPALYVATAAVFLTGIIFLGRLQGIFILSAEPVMRWEPPPDIVPEGKIVENRPNIQTDVHDINIMASSQFNGPLFAAAMPIESKEAWIDWMISMCDDSYDFFDVRWQLASDFVASLELKRPEDIRAFLLTPREHFVRTANKGLEYADRWLPIGWGATITDPDVVAMMTTTLNVTSSDKVLEIGTGSGYQSAILSYLSRNVFTIEIIEPLFHETNSLYEGLEHLYSSYGTISRKLGDGYYGWEQYAPFDKIIVTCSIDHIPPPLLRQLKPGGIMVLPLGSPGKQFIMEVKKTIGSDGKINLTRRDVYNGLSVNFIPFKDEKGASYSK